MPGKDAVKRNCADVKSAPEFTSLHSPLRYDHPLMYAESKRSPVPPDHHRRSVRLVEWQAERNHGFSGCEYIYDASGRLIAVDFELRPPTRVSIESSERR